MEIYLYRITHIDNIPYILQHGIVHRNSSQASAQYVSVGDQSLISYRSTKEVKIENTSKKILIGDFIPFYFGVRMPMLFVIQHGYNFVEKKQLPQDIVYLVVKCSDIVNSGREYYFSDGHATDRFTSFYGEVDYPNINSLLDWTSIKIKQWNGEGVGTDVKRKKQAEFLVKGDIPANLIYGYVCYNELAKERLLRYNIEEKVIKIFPKAYF